MEMGGRAGYLDIDVLFLFFLCFPDGYFAKFVPPGIEGDSRRGGGGVI